jgi:hypothetical protein
MPYSVIKYEDAIVSLLFPFLQTEDGFHQTPRAFNLHSGRCVQKEECILARLWLSGGTHHGSRSLAIYLYEKISSSVALIAPFMGILYSISTVKVNRKLPVR